MSGVDPETVLKGLMGQINHIWATIFLAAGQDYPAPTWQMVHKDMSTPCGPSHPKAVPFYCDTDLRIYLGMGFFDNVAAQLPDPVTARFVLGTILSHEIGHHVQCLNGTEARLHAERAAREAKGDHKGALMDSIELELQADAYSGIWAHHAVAEMSDEAASTALAATNALAHAFDHDAEHVATHGTGDQRMAWFDKGLRRGDPADCALPNQ